MAGIKKELKQVDFHRSVKTRSNMITDGELMISGTANAYAEFNAHHGMRITGSLNVSGSIYLNGELVSTSGGGGSDDHEHNHNHNDDYLKTSSFGHNHNSDYVTTASFGHNHDSNYLNTASLPQRYEWVSNHNYDTTGIRKTWLPWNSTSDNTSCLFFHMWLAPANGKLNKVFVSAEGETNFGGVDPGTTVIGFCRPTNIEETDPSQISAVTASLTRNVTQTFNFSGSATFLEGQLVAISLDSAAKVQNVAITCLWELSGSS